MPGKAKRIPSMEPIGPGTSFYISRSLPALLAWLSVMEISRKGMVKMALDQARSGQTGRWMALEHVISARRSGAGTPMCNAPRAAHIAVKAVPGMFLARVFVFLDEASK